MSLPGDKTEEGRKLILLRDGDYQELRSRENPAALVWLPTVSVLDRSQHHRKLQEKAAGKQTNKKTMFNNTWD